MPLNRNHLPDNWAQPLLGDICEILDAMRVPVNKDERSKRINGKSDHELYPYFGATGQVGVIDDFIFQGEHVLLGEDGAPFLDPFRDKAYIVSNKFWVNNHAHILRSSISNKYLCYYLNQVDFSKHVTGTTRLKLNQASLKQIPVRFPPRVEQHRIVAKIEELFSELDKGIENLKAAREQLKVYRHAVLKHAFEGKLTEQWREENKDRLETAGQLLVRIKQERETCYRQQIEEWTADVKAWEAAGKPGKKPTRPKPSRPLAAVSEEERKLFSPLPTGWGYCRLGEIVDEPKYGTSKRCNYEIDGVGVLRIPNIAHGIVDATDLKYAHFDEDEIQTYNLKSGDILTIRSNGSISLVGKCALISEAEERYLYAGYLIRLRPNQRLIAPEYLISVLSSHCLRTQLEVKAKSTSGVNNINASEIQDLVVPVCGMSEQQELMRRLASSLSSIDVVETEIDKQILRSQSLRGSILRKAFRGQLIAQNPGDEPASVLLERIRAENNEQAKGRDKKSSKKKLAA